MPTRILIAKPGLDGHDRGAKLIARALRDAGFEVIYTGIRQKPKFIAAAAVQDDVDLIGLSILSGAHVALTRKVSHELELLGGQDIPIVVGGTIPSGDSEAMREAGAVGVFPTGSTLEDLVGGIRDIISASAA